MTEAIKEIPNIPAGLKDAASRSALIPFVGAGVSILGGCPNWNELADQALRACIENHKFTYGQLDQIRHLPPRTKLSIARGLESDHGFKIDFAKLIQPTTKKDNGYRAYRALGKLGTRFVTTNYDDWLTYEISEATTLGSYPSSPQDTTESAPARRECFYNVADFTPAKLILDKAVIHLHGSLAAPDSMIMTTREYIARYRNDHSAHDAAEENRALTFLNHLFSTKTVLFVGYSLEDIEILEYIVQKARTVPQEGKTEARHFMLQGFFSHQTELVSSLTAYYRQFGIQLLAFSRDRRDWAQLLEVLDEFARVMPATAPLSLEIRNTMEELLDG